MSHEHVYLDTIVWHALRWPWPCANDLHTQSWPRYDNIGCNENKGKPVCLDVRSSFSDQDDLSRCRRQVSWRPHPCHSSATCMQSRRSCPDLSRDSTNNYQLLHVTHSAWSELRGQTLGWRVPGNGTVHVDRNTICIRRLQNVKKRPKTHSEAISAKTGSRNMTETMPQLPIRL